MHLEAPMILRFFPDLPPRPETAVNAAFRRQYFARWGQENFILCCAGREAEYMPYTPTVSIKAAWSGTEYYDLGHRRLAVDDDHYLIINERQRYGTHVRSARPVGSMSIFFRPGMLQEVSAALAASDGQAADEGPAAARRPWVFAEHLRAHDATVTPMLRAIRRAIEAGQSDDDWAEEQLQQLLTRMIQAEPGYRARAQQLAPASRSTHVELLARIDRAADFILSNYARAISLDDIAAVAQLSKFHLLRLFRRTHGVTPYTFLLRKRLAVAQRLLAAGLPVTAVAEQSGFGTRFTLFRQVRAAYGSNARGLRDAAGAPGSWMTAPMNQEVPVDIRE